MYSSLIRRTILAALGLLIAASPMPAATNATTEITYMVLYTPAAETRAGGEASMLARIQSGVTTINTALADSGLGHISYRLVHTQKLSGNNTTDDLQQASSQLFAMDPIYDIRDTYRADSVSLIVESLSVGAYASIPASSSQAHRSFSYFGVMNYGGYTTAHELGHNMGGYHNNPNPEPTGQTSTATGDISAPYGYNFIGANGIHYKTLMSTTYYSPFDPTGQTILAQCGRFSNPSVLFQGTATGRAGYADMASVIAYWAPIIANTYADTPATPTLVIRANDTLDTLVVTNPASVTLTVELDPGGYSETNADWWAVAVPDTGAVWYYLDSSLQWQSFTAGDLNACYPAYQGPMIALSSIPILSNAILLGGTYTVYFGVDPVMDGILPYPDGPLWTDTISVTVQSSKSITPQKPNS